MTIPFYTESIEGHTTEQVPEAQAAEKIGQQLDMNKWVTAEMKDGTTEMITDMAQIATKEQIEETVKDAPSEAKDESWEEVFNTKEEAKPKIEPTKPKIKVEDLKSVTTTNKLKGG